MKTIRKRIEELQNGDIAIDFSNKVKTYYLDSCKVDSLDLLRIVLREAFYSDSKTAIGKSKYYYAHTKTNWTSSGSCSFEVKIPIEQFFENLIPANWCLEASKSFGHFIKNLKGHYSGAHPNGDVGSCYYYNEKDVNNIGDWSYSFHSTEREIITFEQFEKYILKDVVKKIIGYKAPFDFCGGNVKKGDIFKKNSSINSWYYGLNGSQDYPQPKEIVETWEPVFEELPKEKKIIVNDVEITIYKDKLRAENNEFSLKFIQGMLSYLAEVPGKVNERPWGYVGETIRIGCSSGWTKEHLNKIIKEYNDFN